MWEGSNLTRFHEIRRLPSRRGALGGLDPTVIHLCSTVFHTIIALITVHQAINYSVKIISIISLIIKKSNEVSFLFSQMRKPMCRSVTPSTWTHTGLSGSTEHVGLRPGLLPSQYSALALLPPPPPTHRSSTGVEWHLSITSQEELTALPGDISEGHDQAIRSLRYSNFWARNSHPRKASQGDKRAMHAEVFIAVFLIIRRTGSMR